MTTNSNLLVAVKEYMEQPGVLNLPMYQRLANALADEIMQGRVEPGGRLPTHRELAGNLDVNITTITKAMALLQEAKLVDTRPGRGTRVALHQQPETQFQSAPRNDPGVIDLSVNRPATDAYNHMLAAVLPELSRDPRFASMQDYHPSEGPEWARQAMASWLRQQGVNAHADRIVLCEGAQHGLSITLRSIAEAGDTILTDEVTYQGISALCKMLDIHLVGIETDQDGMRPAAVRRACKKHRPRALFVVSSIQNPTAVTLTLERRRELAAIAEEQQLLLIEDDVYKPLLDASTQPIVNLLPERTIYVSSLSKCIAPGLRMGFVLAPPDLVADIGTSLRVDCWSVPAMSALIATHLIESGRAQDLVVVQREELRARQRILATCCGDLQVRSGATAPHAWLTLPEAWHGHDFVGRCLEQGVAILPGSAFSLNPASQPHAVRINLSAAPTREKLATALTVIARLAHQGPHGS